MPNVIRNPDVVSIMISIGIIKTIVCVLINKPSNKNTIIESAAAAKHLIASSFSTMRVEIPAPRRKYINPIIANTIISIWFVNTISPYVYFQIFILSSGTVDNCVDVASDDYQKHVEFFRGTFEPKPKRPKRRKIPKVCPQNWTIKRMTMFSVFLNVAHYE